MAANQNAEGTRVGDKVRVRIGSDAGARGLVSCNDGSLIAVDLANGGTIKVPVDSLTNYSLAARRAWSVMPKRAGRPRLDEPRKKMVSLRLDVAVLNRLSEAVAAGLIPNREEAVNTWVRDALDDLIGPSVADQNARTSTSEGSE